MKKVLSTIAIAGVATVALASCSKGQGVKVYGREYASESKLTAAQMTALDTTLAGSYDITVWVSDSKGVSTLTEKQIAKFSELYPSVTINATVNPVSEADSANQMITDVASGADIFCFAQDQLARLVQVKGVGALGTDVATRVRANNDASAIAAATVGENMYCYPITSDNGYFMYYDKSVITNEAHLDSLEDLIADCEAAGRKFSFELQTSAWYNASFLFATGCHSDWTFDENGKIVGAQDDFNSDAGVIALRGMQKLLQSECHVSSSQAADFQAASKSAIVITGTWDSATAKKALKGNYGATDLPSFTVDGKSYHLGSFSGNKLMGVKPSTDANKQAVCQLLAEYLSSATCQYDRFKLVGWGPSSKYVAQEEEVKKDVALSALAKQSEYATPQGQIHGDWWEIAKTYAAAAKEATKDDTTALKAALVAYQTAINKIFEADPKEGPWTVTGGFFSDTSLNWTPAKGIPMTVKADDANTWVSEPIELPANAELKVCFNGGWDVSYGKDGKMNNGNFVVAEAGTYIVTATFNYDDMESGCTLTVTKQ